MYRLRAVLRRRPVAGLVIALIVALGVFEARRRGMLLEIELNLHDWLLRKQPAHIPISNRVTLIRIREEDIVQYGHPLPDATLADALTRVLAAQPRAIGIDLYRNLPVGGGQERLRQLFEENSRLVGIEKFPDRDSPGTPPPSWLQRSEQIAFSDIVLDGDGVVRRALLYLWDSRDQIHVSLALRLALSYLGDEGISLASADPAGEVLTLGRAEFRPFHVGDGGYAKADDRGYQMLLDNRRGTSSFESYSLDLLLAGAVPTEALRNRVVIIGTAAPSVKDEFLTPFRDPTGDRRKVHGIEIHAQVVDQLLRRALDGASPVRFLDGPTQAAAIALLCLFGVALGLGAPSVRIVWVGGVALVILLMTAAWAAVAHTYWVPVVPPLIGFVASTGLAVTHVLREERREKAVLRTIFSRHVSKRVLDELWRKREQFMQDGRLRAQRMTVTVLMMDLKGYAEASEKMEPGALLDWINEFLGAMADLVETRGGVVDDYWGDGLKANFSVPIPQATEAGIRNEAQAAVACAQAMAGRLERLNESWRIRGLPTGRMRIGIHTGAVVVGSVGSSERLKYTSAGDTVNVAARLESLDRDVFAGEATTVRILISEETQRLLGNDVAREPLGTRYLSGRAQPIGVWRLRLEDDRQGSNR